MSHMQRTRVMENRAYDHHYDPIFAYSGDRLRQGASRSNYRSAPRQNINAQFRATQVATVPAIMPDGTIGRMPAPAPAAGSGAPAAPARVRGLMGPLSSAQVAGQLSSELLGRSRVKFFKRPVVPFLPEGSEAGAQPSAEEAAAAAEAFAATQQSMSSAVEESHRTFGTQSDYRESETQTDPYTPDYITAPEEPEPEILGLAHLTYGQGLPASMSELKLIRRMREKRAFEASLPPITDQASFERRKAMLEQRELDEWAMREEEMKEEQEARLAVLVDTLKAREAKVEELSEARVELVREAALQQRDATFDALHRERIKLLRQTVKGRAALDAQTSLMSGGSKEITSSSTTSKARTLGARDIIEDYADHSSQVYAPLHRAGKLPVKNQVVDYGIPLLGNFQGLTELERTLPASALGVRVAPPARRADGRLAGVPSLANRRGQAIRADLEYVDKLLENQREAGGPVGIVGEARAQYGRRGGAGMVENVYKKFEPVHRAPTPSVSIPEEEEQARAILLLQRLLRGRMVQNAMYEGKQHAAALIRELRMEEQEVEEFEEDEEEPVHQSLDTLQGDLVSSAFSFAAQEVVRSHQERLVSQLVKGAQLERRHREAEESGRRQAEEIMRAKRERQMREVMEEHARTAERYLAELIEGAVKRYAADAAAQEEPQQPTHAAATAARDPSDDPDAESRALVLGELVADFLLPEVERRRDARTRELEERRFVKLAHESLLSAVSGQPMPPPVQQQQQQQQQPQEPDTEEQ